MALIICLIVRCVKYGVKYGMLDCEDCDHDSSKIIDGVNSLW